MNIKVDGNSGSCFILLSRSTSSSSWGNLQKASSWISDIKFADRSILFKLSDREIRYKKHVRMYFLNVLKKKANGFLNYRWSVFNKIHSWRTMWQLCLSVYNVIICIRTVILRKVTHISFSSCLELPGSFFKHLSVKDFKANSFKISVCSGNLLNGFLLKKKFKGK